MNDIKNNRYEWIDTGKGWLILSVLFYHCEKYYNNDAIVSLFWIPFFMTCFFFMSGFLFHTKNEFNISHKIKSIIHKLLWSYLTFTSIILVPKALVRGYGIMEGVKSVIMGEASWYVAALIVAEIILSLLFIKTWKQYQLLLISISLLLISIFLNNTINYEPWFFIKGISGASYMILGHLFYLNKEKFNHLLKIKYSIISIIAFVIIRYAMFIYDKSSIYNENSLPWDFSIYTIMFYIESIIGIMMCYIFFNLFTCRYIRFAGKNSLLFYYLNGGIILLFSIAFNKMLPYNYMFVIVIFAITNLLLSFSSILINRYFPFLLILPIKNK